jgi:hypothetical protein
LANKLAKGFLFNYAFGKAYANRYHHTSSYKKKYILTFPPQPLPLTKGGAWSQTLVCSNRAANKRLTLFEKKEKEIMTV